MGKGPNHKLTEHRVCKHELSTHRPTCEKLDYFRRRNDEVGGKSRVKCVYSFSHYCADSIFRKGK